MNKKFLVIKNSSIGLLSQVMTIIFAFITRDIFIRYIGMELLGINGTFASVLNTLSLSELGFETAVVYSLYRPIQENNTEKINDIINILKVVYRSIGILLLLLSVLLLPFLKYILVDIKLEQKRIYLYFLLQASASICTYFLSYKRTLLYVNQKEYISKTIDMIVNCLLNILQCIFLIKFRSYTIYLFLKFGQVLISNIIIYLFCSVYYPYLHNSKINFDILREITKNVKNIFIGRIAGLVYVSTDGLVISSFINTVTVAFYGNYTIIVTNLKNLSRGLFAPIMPIVGNYLVEEKNNTKRETIFLLYTHVRFWITLIIVIPCIVLIDDVIQVWLGEKYILPSVITYLLAAEFYIDLVHSATVDYINGIGLFRLDKYIELVGAASNVFFSIILVHMFGLSGVILGTVISQCLFWVGRSTIVYYKGMHKKTGSFLTYWMKNLFYFLVFITCSIVCSFVYSKIKIPLSSMKIFVGGVICEICIVVLGCVIMFWIKEQKRLIVIMKDIIRDIFRKLKSPSF